MGKEPDVSKDSIIRTESAASLPPHEEKAASGAVLISRFSALGDVAMTIPSIYDVCRAHPSCRFVMLTRSHPASLFINKPDNLTVKGINTDDYPGVGGMWRLSRELKREFGIETYVDLHDVLRTKMLRLFLRLRGVKCVKRIRKGRRAKEALTRRHNKVLLPLASTPSRYNDALRRASLSLPEDFTDRFTSLFSQIPADPSVFSEASEPKTASEIWIAIAPFAKHQGKIYPMQLMKEVVDHFAAKTCHHVFLLGAGEKEASILESIKDSRPNVVNMARVRLPLSAELALLSYCDVMVSMDSANMHMASLVELPVISVWGATHPYAGFLGWKQREEDIVQLDMVCRPCSVFGNRPCNRNDYHCLGGISPARIIEHVEARLAASGKNKTLK